MVASTFVTASSSFVIPFKSDSSSLIKLLNEQFTLSHSVCISVIFNSFKSNLKFKVAAVSAIDWIPGYGSVIIVTHKGDFRTVYSHLGEIFVNEGDKLISGNLIGKVGESLEGNVLHFEIWNSRNNQDPEIWLAKK